MSCRCLAVLFLLVAACTRNVELLPDRDGASVSDGGGSDASDDAGVNDGSSQSSTDFASSCSGASMPVRVESGGVEQCTGVISASAHRYALCLCSSLTINQSLGTDAFDSTGLTSGDQIGAAVGINGDLASTSSLSLGGALYVAGAGGAALDDQTVLSESLHVAGPFSTNSGAATVGTDAYVAGDITGMLGVTGTLHVPQGASVDPAVNASTTVREPVTVLAPCDCAPDRADVGKAVAAAAQQNDNASIGITPTRLVGNPAPLSLELSCGRFFLDGIDTLADVTVKVHGRASLAVQGDVAIRSSFTVVLDSGAELDLLVAGKIALTGGGTIGNKVAPSRVRIWSTADAILLDNAPVIGAVIHAPGAAVSAPQGVELYGSLLAQSLTIGGGIDVHYDRAILSSGVVCGAPAQPAVH